MASEAADADAAAAPSGAARRGGEEDDAGNVGELDEDGAKEDDDGWSDILGGGVVLKKTVREGEGPTPEYKCLAYVHYVGRVQSQEGEEDIEPFEVTREMNDGEPVEVTIGDNVLEEVVPGLTLAIRLMKEGEVADVKINHRFAYAHLGLGDKVKPNEDVEFRVELVRVGEQEKEPVDMTPEELIASVRKRKARGNAFFEMGRLDKALQCYQDGLKKSESHLPPPPQPGQEEEQETTLPANDPYNSNPELIKLRAQCAGNAAACFEKQRKWKEASDACVAALSLDPQNLKYLLRAANVTMMNGNFEEAKACLGAAKDFHADNPAVAHAVRKFKEHLRAHKAKEKAAFGGFFESASSPSAPASSASSPKSASGPTPAPSPSRAAGEKGAPSDQAPASDQRPLQPAALRKLLNLAVLLAPTLVVLLAFLLVAPASAHAVVPLHLGAWANASDDEALAILRAASLGDSLSCQGRPQRSSCCVCQEMMHQATLRQDQAARARPTSTVQVGFRLDNKRHVPFYLTEDVALTILERVCGRLPLDIPFDYENVERAKVAIIKACDRLIDAFHDDLLALLTRPIPAHSSLGHEACTNLMGLCAARSAWPVALRSFGNAYLTLPCAVCTETSALAARAASEEMPHGELAALLRDPSRICADLAVKVAADPSQVDEISTAIGDACVDIVYENRAEIARLAESAVDQVCPRELTLLLCAPHCPASTLESL